MSTYVEGSGNSVYKQSDSANVFGGPKKFRARLRKKIDVSFERVDGSHVAISSKERDEMGYGERIECWAFYTSCRAQVSLRQTAPQAT